MSHAPDYTPTTSFATDETNSVAGRSTVKTVSLDTELADISSSIIALNNNLKLIQRDDGKIQDGEIEPYALSTQTRALLAAKGTARGNWAQNTNYIAGESLQYSSTAYIVLSDHNSGTVFVPALYMAISDDGSAAAAAGAAAASAAAAFVSQNSATSSASTATTQAGIATTQAGIATTQATNAANIAASAASLISGSIAGASQAEAEAGTNNSKYMSPLRVKQAIDFNKPVISSKIQPLTAVITTNTLVATLAATTNDFRNTTLNNGAVTTITNSSISITAPTAASLGLASGVSGRIAVLEANNAGTPVLCYSNLAGGLSLDETNLISPTLIGAGSTSANVIYSASAVAANSAYRVVGYIDATWTSGTGWALTKVQGIGGQANTLIKQGRTANSGAYVAVAGETLSLAHGLAVKPTSCVLVFECTTADLGFSIGDTITIQGGWTGAAVYPINPYVDATNCAVKFAAGNSVHITNKTTGASASPTNSRWIYYFIYTYN